jgi:hypothetical protein
VEVYVELSPVKVLIILQFLPISILLGYLCPSQISLHPSLLVEMESPKPVEELMELARKGAEASGDSEKTVVLVGEEDGQQETREF